jgi:inosine-uridine nucleoside N-ribohydrolase
MTNLAHVLSAVPDLADRLRVTQMGGWLDHYRDTSRASHNFHTAPRSAGLALRLLQRPRLVPSDHTNHVDIQITADSAVFRHLSAAPAPEWAHLVAANFRAWFGRRPGSWMHDPLTLSAAIGLPFIDFRPEQVHIERDARLYCDPAGRDVLVSTRVDYPGFVAWMSEVVRW